MSNRYLRLRQNSPVILLFAFCILLTSLVFLVQQKAAREKIIAHATDDAIEFQRTLQQGINSYIHLNRDLAGFFAASPIHGQKELDAYLNTSEALKAHPGLSYVGYVPRIAVGDRKKFLADVHREDPAYTLHGHGQDAGFSYSLLHAYPRDERMRQLSGLDFSGIPERWEAMQQARDLGKSIATAKHAYLNDPNGPAIVIVFTPVYDLKRPVSTIEQRRIALRGFVFSIYQIEQMVEQVMGTAFKSMFDLEIYDGFAGDRNILYDGDKEPHVLLPLDQYPVAHQQKISIANRDWHLYFLPKPIYAERYRTWDSVLILLFGFAISFAVSFFVWKWLRLQRAKVQRAAHDQRFQAVFENHPSAVYSLDLKRRFINANAQALKEFKLGKEKLLGMSVERLIVPENQHSASEDFKEVLAGNSVSYDSAIINGDGARIEVSVILIPISIDGQVKSVLGIAQNITERKQAEWRLQESKKMLQLVINHIPQRVFWKNTELVYLGCNDAFCRDAGLESPEQIVGKTDFELSWRANAEMYRKDDQETMRSNQAKINFEEPQRREDGSESWLRTSKIPLEDIRGKTIALLGLYEDITERKALEHELQEMAHSDSLTGLVNRRFFYHHLELAVKRSRRRDSLFALMYLDLDKFKSINDQFGHVIGDGLLKAFAQRIKATVRETDVVGRLGGDEFALLLEDLGERKAAESVAAKLVQSMQAPFQIEAAKFEVSTSIGIAFFKTGMAADEMVQSADQAMYRAKHAGRNRFEVDPV
jgi:diguanylate cyclase (GGDEF)-like protein/PAS domain S-box-containing protein